MKHFVATYGHGPQRVQLEIKDPRGQAAALHEMGRSHLARKDVAAARPALEESLALCGQPGGTRCAVYQTELQLALHAFQPRADGGDRQVRVPCRAAQ